MCEKEFGYGDPSWGAVGKIGKCLDCYEKNTIKQKKKK